MFLQGKRALVTGAGAGIGEATAVALARAGADVAVADLDADSLEETREKLRSLGCRSVSIQADIGELVVGKNYILRIQVMEDGGADYSPQVEKKFSVVD